MRRQFLIPFLAVLLVIPTVAPAAVAQDSTSDVAIDYHQSVLAQLSNVGRVRDAKVVTQMTATGEGPVQITATDAATQGLRNLDGFGKPAISDGALTWDLDLAGTENTRTIADFDRDLPLGVSVGYELDGETVRASRMRNRSGMVTVNYTVENSTASPTEVSFKDPEGNTVTETVDVVVPYVATLTVALPGEFRDIEAEGATIYGDGQGNTIVRWTMLLFEPLGESTADVSVTARSRRGTVPGATLEAIPVSSGTFASLASALEQYDGAEQDTQTLRNGARDLDRGAVRLAAGVSRLLDGLTQLADGSEELEAGLVRARDGARELGDGTTRASAGSNELKLGLGRLRDGAFELGEGARTARNGATQLADGNAALARGLEEGFGRTRDGASQIADGNATLAAGLRDGFDQARHGAGRVLAGLNEIDGGLALLSHPTEGLPAGRDGIADLRAGVKEMQDGMGDPDNPGPKTIIGGLDALNQGAQVLAGRVPAVSPGLPGAKDGVDLVAGMLAGDPVPPNPFGVDQSVSASLAALGAALQHQALGDTPPDPLALPTLKDLMLMYGCVAGAPPEDQPTQECGIFRGYQLFLLGVREPMVGGDANLRVLVQGLAGESGLGRVSAGLGDAIDGVTLMADNLPTLADGARRVSRGLSSGSMRNPGVDEGLVLLDRGLVSALDGIGKLKGGAELLVDGQGRLVDGLATFDGRATSGADDLAAGSSRLKAGLDEFSDRAQPGADELASGSERLSRGLGLLDDGTQRLANGARDAATGAGDLNEGLERIDEGTNTLARGLVDAADGGSRLADGLKMAKVGGGQAAAGAETLQETGTEVLLEKVSEGFSGRSELAAHLHAVDERGASEGLPYGAPEEANATAAYRFLIAGAADTGAAGDAGRGLAGVLLLLGAVALGGVARRRLLV